MTHKQKGSGINQNWTVTVNPGNKYVESYAGVFTWYMMETKDDTSSFSFKLEIENNHLVSFNGQSIILDYQLRKFKFQHNNCRKH